MTIKVVPDANISLYYEYGTTSGVYTQQTATGGHRRSTHRGGHHGPLAQHPLLLPDAIHQRWWCYLDTRAEHSFWTQRAAGSTFTFDITTDSHINIQLGNASNWSSTLNGVASDNPDFLVDLGDTVAMDNGSTSVA